MREGKPVASELNPGAVAAVVGEAPSEQDAKAERPFTGKGAVLMLTTLGAHGLARENLALTHVLSCRPPKGKMDTVMLKLKKINKQRIKDGDEPMPSPMKCCEPRLKRDIDGISNIITLGKLGAQAILGSNASILEIRGGPIERTVPREDAEGRPLQQLQLKVLPTLHPSFVLRARRWIRAFKADLGRAARWFRTGQLQWTAPNVKYKPSAEWLVSYFKRLLAEGTMPGDSRPSATWDVETCSPIYERPELAKESMLAQLRCVGVYNERIGGFVVPIRSKEDYKAFYVSDEHDRIVAILKHFLTHPGIRKDGWNSGYYDRIVIQRQWGITPAPMLDWILVHRCVEPELPHKLGYVGSVWTDVPSWKAARTATEAESEEELWIYNGIDCAVNARITGGLKAGLTARTAKRADHTITDQSYVVKKLHQIQNYCVEMKLNGMLVDPIKVREYDVKFRTEAVFQLRKIKECLGLDNFNPQSTDQVKDLLFTKWGLTPVNMTDSGEPSTDDDSMRELQKSPGLTEAQRAFFDHNRRFRRATKKRGTYVRRLIPNTMPVMPDDLSLDLEESEEERSLAFQAKGGKRWGLIFPDGRMHPDWNCHSVVTVRLSSSNLNATNFPRDIRDMMLPAPGNGYIYVDQDQLELRLASGFARAQHYLRIFEKDGDPHTDTALIMFGAQAVALYKRACDALGTKKAKNDPQWSRLRDFAKQLTYSSIYRASIETVHAGLTSAEDPKTGNQPFANEPLSKTRAAYNAWMKLAPEFEQWWDSTEKKFQSQGYLCGALWGTRCDFEDGTAGALGENAEENLKNKIANYECQTSGAELVHEALIELTAGADAPLRFERWGKGTGLIAQGHDSALFEVPLDQLEKMSSIVTEAFTRRIPGLPIQFKGKAAQVERWC